MISERRKPNLFIVGAPKCGTTALHYYLSQHPDIYMSEPKEPNYFGTLVESFAKTDEQYLDYAFSGWREEQVAGEATPFYLACPTAAGRIFRFNPNASIIVMLRNPVDAMYSLHSEFFFGGSEQEEDFVAALALEGRRLAGESVRTTSNPPFRHAYKWMTNFGTQVERYSDLFPPEKIMFIFQEEMKQDMAAIYRRVLDFLQVEPTLVPEFPRINANKRARSTLVRRVLLHPPAWLRSVARRVIRDDALQHGIRRSMRKLNRRINAKSTSRIPLQSDLRSRLLEEKREEIERLAQIIGRDLSHWMDGSSR